MVESNLTIIVIFVLYLVMMLAIGLMAYKKTSNTEDYFLGGRKLGSWVVSLSAQASDMSGWMLMGLPGAAYIAGLEAGWIALGLTIGTYLNWKLVAKRLRNYTEACNAITIPQFLGNRYRDDQNILRIVSSLFILIFFLVYTASAFVSGGKLFSTVFGIDYTLALLICAIVVVSYTFAGGFFAVCWTDLVQGILMFVAIVIVPCAAVVSMGGIDATIARIEAVNVNMLNPFITIDGTHIAMITVISSLAWGLGYFGQPHILVRFMGIDDAKSIKKSRLIAMVWVIFSLTAATLVGLLGRVFLTQDLSNSSGETVYILMVMKIFPLIIAGVFLAAILAAHDIPYVAQTTLLQGFKDMHVKAEKAIYTDGPAFLNVMSPCPTGWKYKANEIMEICKLGVETNYWPLFEVIDGKWILNYEPKKRLPIEEFLRTQGRFKHLFKPENEHLIEEFQKEVDRRWDDLLFKCSR